MTDIEVKPVPPNLIAREAIKDIRRMSWSLRGLMSLGKELDGLADLQDFIKQEEARLAGVKAAAEKLDADAAARRATADQEATKLAALQQQARALAGHCAAEQQRALTIVKDAQQQAAAILERATIQGKQDAERILNDEIEKLKAKLGLGAG